MKKHSAGLIVFRRKEGKIEILLAHMGSPWWAKKDVGAWTIPKGGIEEGETELDAAKREFVEEMGIPVPDGKFIDLGKIDQNNNKDVRAYAIEANPDVSRFKSVTFEVEWPRGSGKIQEFPEIDRVAWLSLPTAAQKSIVGQAGLFEQLATKLQVPFEKRPDKPASQQPSLF